MSDWRDIPVFINARDRVLDLRKLVTWLENAGHQRIILLDNHSSYEPLLEFYKHTPHEVVRFRINHGKLSLWKAGLVPAEPFVFTDPDLVPIAHCPVDMVGRLLELQSRCAPWQKVGLGLHLADVPASMRSLRWEQSLVGIASDEFPDPQGKPVPELSAALGAGVWASLVDTTFAVYGAKAPFGLNALRTGYPYQARHLPWYPAANEAERAEREFYLARARGGPDGSSWKDGLQV